MRTDVQFTQAGAATTGAGALPTVFGRRTRLTGSAAIVAVAAAGTGLSALAPSGRDGFVLAHALVAAPFVAGTLTCSGLAARRGAPAFRPFWRSWFAANVLAALAVLAATGSVLLDSPALLVLDMAFLVGATPIWVAAGVRMVRLQAGRRDPGVDVIDGTMAALVLSVPAALLLAEPLRGTAHPAFAGPFALFLLLIPSWLHGACVCLARVPRGERAVHALGLTLAGTFTVSVSLQLARVLELVDLPLPVFAGAHAANMALVTALPLWAHRAPSGGLARLPVHEQLRRSNPVPAIAAAVLSPLAVYVLAARRHDGWAVGHLVAVLLALAALNAVRHARLGREARRLSAELARMAEQRRELLGNLVRALEDDRRRAVSELHSQAVGSLSTLGTLLRTACVSLPAATSAVVREAIAQLQDDLHDRAEELRVLLAAMRTPALDASPGDDVLAAALRAYAADLVGDAGDPAPDVRIAVSPALDLDRRTLAVAYRIAQEALRNAVRHARAGAVTVSVEPDRRTGAVVVEVVDDGAGFDPAQVAEGSGLASMRLFAELGGGELAVRSVPGGGTVVRSRLGGRAATCRPPAVAAPPGHLVTSRPPTTPGHAATPAGDPRATDGDPRPAVPSGEPATARPHLRLVPRLDGPAPVG
ncbi:MAG TPA: ATP-binding protein [Acidimicrobiales bacterium]